MLFRVDFIQGKTTAADYLQVKHSLIDTATDRKILSLTVSADKLQSVSNYSREPKRVVFEVFPSQWITDYILSGNYEHERYISHYEVRIFRDNVLFFSGIIDTSQLSYDVSTEILKLTCYDKIKLLSLFSDLTHYYSLFAGYQPLWILQYFIQDIQQTIPINIPYTSAFSYPAVILPSVDMLTLSHVDYADMLVLPPESGGWTYSIHASGWAGPYYGYTPNVTGNRVTFIFAHKVVTEADLMGLQSQYRVHYRARIITYFNGICPVFVEYEKKSGWGSLDDLEKDHDDFVQFLNDNSYYETILANLVSTHDLSNRNYVSSHYVGNWVEAAFYGHVLPVYVHPGDSYTTLQSAQTDNLKVLQAVLMAYNSTLSCGSQGNIILTSKGSYSSAVIDIDESDVISLSLRRGNQEVPNTSNIAVLAGDTTALQAIIKTYLMEFYAAKWSATIVIDKLDTYAIALQSKIRIQGVEYAIIQIERDFIKDEYRVKAWQLN